MTNGGLANAAYDVAVIGAGPAGAVAARGAAQRGASVLLVDKARYPRAKVCGCCLSRDALATLDRLGLGGVTRQLGAVPLHGFRLAAGRDVAHVSLPEGAAVSRAALDAALVDAAEDLGVDFHDAAQASLCASASRPGEAHQLTIRAANASHRVSARILLVADGLGGRLLDAHPGFHVRVRPEARIGIAAMVVPGRVPHAYGPGTVHMACARRGYVGLVRLEDGTLDVAAALDPRFVRDTGSAQGAVASILHEVGWPMVDAPCSAWRGTARLSRRRRPLGRDGILLLGDAAGYVEPFTGEGIAWALRAGEAAGRLAGGAVRKGETEILARRWTSWYRRTLSPRHWRCRLIAGVLRRGWMVRAVTRHAGRLPWLTGPMVRAITAPAAPTARLVDGDATA